MRSTVAQPQSSAPRRRRTEFRIFIATAGSTPERRKRSRIVTARALSSAAAPPVPMPSESSTQSTPASVLK